MVPLLKGVTCAELPVMLGQKTQCGSSGCLLIVAVTSLAAGHIFLMNMNCHLPPIPPMMGGGEVEEILHIYVLFGVLVGVNMPCIISCPAGVPQE